MTDTTNEPSTADIEDLLTALLAERAAAVPPQSAAVPPQSADVSIPVIGPDATSPTMPWRPRRLPLMLAAAAVLVLLVAGVAQLADRSPTRLDAATTAGGEPAGTTDDAALSEADGTGRDAAPSEADGAEALTPDQWLAANTVDQPVLVVTGAEWCSHCAEQLPDLIDTIEQAAPAALVVGFGSEGDGIWDQVDWPFAVQRFADDPLPTGMDAYPQVALWTSDGMVGEAPVALNVDADYLRTTVADALAQGPDRYRAFRDVVSMATLMPNDQRPVVHLMAAMNAMRADACGLPPDKDPARFDQERFADLGLIADETLNPAANAANPLTGLANNILTGAETPAGGEATPCEPDGLPSLDDLQSANWHQLVDEQLTTEEMMALERTASSCLSTDHPDLRPFDDQGNPRSLIGPYLGLVDQQLMDVGPSGAVDTEEIRRLSDRFVNCTTDYYNALAARLYPHRQRVVADNHDALSQQANDLLASGYVPYRTDG